ncbi:hypothetical protein HYV57_02855 [Candidatus Peregrinibacteria bacterium]|nr:hypothetical protein [Candidatus Peregrinibacteria bacterium]
MIPFQTVSAANTNGDLFLTSENIFFSQTELTEGKNVRIYASVTNAGQNDALGTVRFYDAATGTQIDSDQPISVIAGKTDDVFVDWIPSYGTYTIYVTLDPWNSETDDPNNNSASKTTSVDRDTDRDGTGNQKDSDDDNDGVKDNEDIFPLDKKESKDTDNDGIGNNTDLDDDDDGTIDTLDAFPEDSKEALDSDKDAIGNNQDTDDDNDGLSDDEEIKKETDPKKEDTDGDGVDDKTDIFPKDSTETKDFDQDGIGDTKDTDDDNDGVNDDEDSNDENKGPVIALNEIPKTISPGTELSLSAENTFDPDGKIASIEWKIIKDEPGATNILLADKQSENFSGPVLNKLFAQNGMYTLTVQAIDDKGEIRSSNFKIEVNNSGRNWALTIFFLLLAFLAIFYYTATRNGFLPSQWKTGTKIRHKK